MKAIYLYAIIAAASALVSGLVTGATAYKVGHSIGAADPLAKLATCQAEQTAAASASSELLAKAQADKKAAEDADRKQRAEAQATYAAVLQQNAIELTAARNALREARKDHAQLLDTRLPDALVCGLRGEAADCADGSSRR